VRIIIVFLCWWLLRCDGWLFLTSVSALELPVTDASSELMKSGSCIAASMSALASVFTAAVVTPKAVSEPAEAEAEDEAEDEAEATSAAAGGATSSGYAINRQRQRGTTRGAIMSVGAVLFAGVAACG
jgi:hypothetical protein